MRGQPRATTASRPARTRVAYRGMGSNGVVSRAASRDTDSALDVSRDVESSDEVERGVRPRRRELAWRPNAWAVFAAATLVQSCSGLAYSFGVYSDDLRTVYPSQSAVDLLGTAKDVGTYFGVAGGVLYDAFGARATLLAGALIHLAGYLGVWATLTRQPGFVDPPLWRTALIVAVAANGNSLFDTAALLPSMDNFPLERGVVVGILKAYLGLSSAIFAQLYATFIPRDGPTAAKDPTAAFVVLVAVVGAAVAVAAGAVFFPRGGRNRETRRANVRRLDRSSRTRRTRQGTCIVVVFFVSFLFFARSPRRVRSTDRVGGGARRHRLVGGGARRPVSDWRERSRSLVGGPDVDGGDVRRARRALDHPPPRRTRRTASRRNDIASRRNDTSTGIARGRTRSVATTTTSKILSYHRGTPTNPPTNSPTNSPTRSASSIPDLLRFSGVRRTA